MTGVEVSSDLWGSIERRIASTPQPEEDGLWDHLAELVDTHEMRPKIADDVELREFKQRWGGDYAMIANPRDLLHYRLLPGDAELVRLMDGTRTVKEIVLERFRESGDLELSGVADLVWMLYEGNFLDKKYVDVNAATLHAIAPESAVRQRAKEFAKENTIAWRSANGFVKWCHDHGLKYLLTRPALVASIALNVLGVVAFFHIEGTHQFSLSGESLAVAFVVLMLLNYFVIFVHEWGHALLLVHYGRRVKEAGFMLYFGSPTFYVESGDGLMLEPRKRILQAAAGPYFETYVAAPAAILVWLFPTMPLVNVVYRFAVLNYLNLFLNFIPLIELDGYWILCDTLRVPELRPKSLSFVRHDLFHKLRTREKWNGQEVGLAMFGILGAVFTAVAIYVGLYFWKDIFGTLFSRLWHGGSIARILLLALIVLIVGPLIRGLIALLRSLALRIRAVWRDLRFKFQTKWRVEAARLIDALPIFDDVPEETLSELAGRVKLRSVARGEPIVRQGERATAFYVVRRGTLQVVEEDPISGNERSLRVLGRGEGFGEVGLAEGSPRTATVRALEEAQLFEIDKGTFDQLLRDMVHVPQFAPALQGIAELRELKPFRSLEPDELGDLLKYGSWVNFPPGADVITEGEVADAFFAIRSGQADVFEGDEYKRTLVAGDFFGEIALLLDVPRTATVTAKTPVRAYRLEREGFDKLISETFKRGTLNPHISPDRVWKH